MEGKIDIRLLFKKVISKWYYFVLIGMVILPLAYLYIKLADRVYYVRASILLSSEMENGIRSDKFLKGMDLQGRTWKATVCSEGCLYHPGTWRYTYNTSILIPGWTCQFPGGLDSW